MIMGLLKLLTFPVSGPLLGGRWVLRTVLDEAERRYYDPAAIQQEIEDIERRHQAGELDNATFENLEDSLLQRVRERGEELRGVKWPIEAHAGKMTSSGRIGSAPEMPWPSPRRGSLR